jgi:cell division protein ZapA (FtsZ GTPase activity inhibitor)
MNNDLEIQIDGKRYRLPLDRGARTKLNSVPADTVRVRLEVGAFRYVLS